MLANRRSPRSAPATWHHNGGKEGRIVTKGGKEGRRCPLVTTGGKEGRAYFSRRVVQESRKRRVRRRGQPADSMRYRHAHVRGLMTFERSQPPHGALDMGCGGGCAQPEAV